MAEPETLLARLGALGALALASGALSFFPALFLAASAEPFEAGAPWLALAWWSAHLAHWDLAHWAKDIALAALWLALAPWASIRRSALGALAAAPLLCAALFWALPELRRYGGLSGLLFFAIAWTLLDLAAEAKLCAQARAWAAAGLLALAARAAVGWVGLPDEPALALWQACAAWAHALGLLLAVALWLLHQAGSAQGLRGKP